MLADMSFEKILMKDMLSFIRVIKPSFAVKSFIVEHSKSMLAYTMVPLCIHFIKNLGQ